MGRGARGGCQRSVVVIVDNNVATVQLHSHVKLDFRYLLLATVCAVTAASPPHPAFPTARSRCLSVLGRKYNHVEALWRFELLAIILVVEWTLITVKCSQVFVAHWLTRSYVL